MNSTPSSPRRWNTAIARDILPGIRARLEFLQQVGLSYLSLDRAAPTLPGGEDQRIKLVTELVKARPDVRRQQQSHTLSILDEPTVGLHMADVERLIRVLHRLSEDLREPGHPAPPPESLQ